MKNIHSNMSFDNEGLFYVGLLISVTPLWLAHYLPGVDLPGHAAQAVALVEIWRENPLFTEHFRVNLLTPYLAGTTLLALLSFVMPIEIAVKVVVSAVVVATPILGGKILDAIGGDSRWRWLIIPSTYSFAFHWGLFPYVAAVPLGLVLILLTVKLHRLPGIGLSLFIAAYSLFLFFSHILVLCFSSMLALAWLAGCNYRQPKRLAALCIPYTVTLPLIFAWLYTTLNSGTYMTDKVIVTGSFLKHLLDITVQSTGLDGTFFGISACLIIFIVVLPFASRMKLTRRPEKWAMAACGIAAFMLFPSYGMGTAFLYERFGLYLPILWFVLWEKTPADTPRWHWLGIVAVFIWAIGNMLRFSTFNIETRGFDGLMAEMEPAKRMLSIMADKNSSQFTAPILLHVPSWYQAKQHGIVDYNFGMFYGTMVQFKTDKRPPDTGMLSWIPDSFDWQEYRGDDYDYFVIRSRADISAEIFKDRRSSVELVRKEDIWWLYKNISEER